MTHRDIKPSNLMLSENCDGLKYIDFGLSKQTKHESSFMRTKVGTTRYMAPEIFLEDKFSQKIDIWYLP